MTRVRWVLLKARQAGMKEDTLWSLRFSALRLVVQERRLRRWKRYKKERRRLARARRKLWQRRQAWLLRWRPDRWLRLQMRLGALGRKHTEFAKNSLER